MASFMCLATNLSQGKEGGREGGREGERRKQEEGGGEQ